MKNFDHYNVVSMSDGLYLYDEKDLKYIKVTRKEAYTLQLLIKGLTPKKALQQLKEKYPKFNWSLNEIETTKKKYKKAFRSNKETVIVLPKVATLRFTLALLLFFVVLTSIFCLKNIKHFNFDSFFWSKNIFFSFLSAFAIYVLSKTLHEIFQWFVVKSFKVSCRLQLFDSYSIVHLIINEEDFYALSKENRLLIHSAGLLSQFILLDILFMFVTAFAFLNTSILMQAVILILLKIALEFVVFLRTDVYMILTDVLNNPKLQEKALQFNKSKGRGIFVYRMILIMGICLGIALLWNFILPIKAEIYTRAFQDSFFSFFSLDSIYFLECIGTLFLELLIDFLTFTFVLKSFFKD